MFTINFVVTPGGAPVEKIVSAASALEGAIQNAEQLIKNTFIAGLKRDPDAIAYAIEDESGAYLGTWIKGRKVDNA